MRVYTCTCVCVCRAVCVGKNSDVVLIYVTHVCKYVFVRVCERMRASVRTLSPSLCICVWMCDAYDICMEQQVCL